MHEPRRSRPWSLAACGVAVALGLGACGEDARSSERAGDAREPAAESAAGSTPPAQATSAVPSTAPVPATTPTEVDEVEAPLDGRTPGQVAAIHVAAMVEGCFAARPDYRLCTRPQSAGHLKLPPIVDGPPEPGEAQVVAGSARSYTVVSRDADGTAWTIERGADGITSRACASSDPGGCDDPAWASPAG